MGMYLNLKWELSLSLISKCLALGRCFAAKAASSGEAGSQGLKPLSCCGVYGTTKVVP
jgi:hypothetical protein